MVACVGTLCSCRGQSVTFVAASTIPSPVVLRDIRTFEEKPEAKRSDDRFAVMEVVNESNAAVDPVIRFRFWDKAGQPRQIKSARALAGVCTTLHSTHVLWPGEKMPCVTEVPSGAVTASYEIELLKDENASLGGRTRTALRVVGAELRSDRVDGSVENPFSASICSAEVAVSFYDSSGRIVGWEHDWVLPSRIEPGARTRFEVDTHREPAPVASFSATAWTLYPIASDCD
jgi:hypothetical protein